MSAGNKIVNVRFDDSAYARMTEEVERRNGASRDAVWTVSDYVRNAVLEKIAHSDRGRGRKKDKRFKCRDCQQTHSEKHLGYYIKPIFGRTEKICVFCMQVRPTSI